MLRLFLILGLTSIVSCWGNYLHKNESVRIQEGKVRLIGLRQADRMNYLILSYPGYVNKYSARIRIITQDDVIFFSAAEITDIEIKFGVSYILIEGTSLRAQKVEKIMNSGQEYEAVLFQEE